MNNSLIVKAAAHAVPQCPLFGALTHAAPTQHPHQAESTQITSVLLAFPSFLEKKYCFYLKKKKTGARDFEMKTPYSSESLSCSGFAPHESELPVLTLQLPLCSAH